MSAKIKLKSCPFCGEAPNIGKYSRMEIRGISYKIECNYCEVSPSTPLYEDKMEAVKTWNTRIHIIKDGNCTICKKSMQSIFGIAGNPKHGPQYLCSHRCAVEWMKENKI